MGSDRRDQERTGDRADPKKRKGTMILAGIVAAVVLLNAGIFFMQRAERAEKPAETSAATMSAAAAAGSVGAAGTLAAAEDGDTAAGAAGSANTSAEAAAAVQALTEAAGISEAPESGTAAAAEETSAPASGSRVIAERAGRPVLDVPLSEDGCWVFIDNHVLKQKEPITLEELGELAKPELHAINILMIKDGKVRVSEANCDNQVCVMTGEITGSKFDLPIICLPHELAVYVVTEEEGREAAEAAALPSETAAESGPSENAEAETGVSGAAAAGTSGK